MSRKDALVLASRTLALLLVVWALGEASYLPERVHSFLRYNNQEPGASTAIQYWRHYYLISLGFLVTRLFKVGPEVEELFLHLCLRKALSGNDSEGRRSEVIR